MRRLLIWLGVCALGLALGAGSGVFAVSRPLGGSQTYDGWSSSPLIGSSAADPYTRALVARTGLLALTRAETIYFNRTADEQGRPLSAACDYVLSGGALPARWWSVTLYAADNYLARNGDHAPSFDATHSPPAGPWTVTVSPVRPSGPWISSRNGGAINLTLRLYNPTPAALAAPQNIAFPKLKTLSCKGGGA